MGRSALTFCGNEGCDISFVSVKDRQYSYETGIEKVMDRVEAADETEEGGLLLYHRAVGWLGRARAEPDKLLTHVAEAGRSAARPRTFAKPDVQTAKYNAACVSAVCLARLDKSKVREVRLKSPGFAQS